MTECSYNSAKLLNEMDFSLFTSHFSRKRAAFTLAEVLITLGIIGVVAAITLPSLINNHQNKQLETALQKNYSVLQQLLVNMSQDNGEIITPNSYYYLAFADNCLKYLDYEKNCSPEKCVTKGTTEDAYAISNYKNFSKTSNISTFFFDDGQILLKNGSLIMIEHPDYTGLPEYTGQPPLYITIDVNGHLKPPNAWGHDLFTFQLMNNGKLLPMGHPETDYAGDSYCSKSNKNTTRNGLSCAYFALTDKNYWKNLPH